MALAFGIVLSLAGQAQRRALHFISESIEEGLSQGTVTAILQDHEGYLWLGTQDGLNRYDGYEFEIFRHDRGDPQSLPNSSILALAEDRNGDLWIGARGGGLTRWRRATGTFETFRHRPDDPDSLAEGDVRALAVDGQRLWIGTASSGLDQLDLQTLRFRHFRHDPDDQRSVAGNDVRSLLRDRQGDLWIGTMSGLSRLRPGDSSFESFRHDPENAASLAEDRVRGLSEGRQGRIWVGTYGRGLDRLDPTTSRFEHFLVSEEIDGTELVRAVLEDRSGRVWIGTDGGLGLMTEPDQMVFYRSDVTDPKGLKSDRVMSLFEDRSGLIWIGTQGSGVARWNPHSWTFAHYQSEPEGLSSNAVMAFAEAGDGDLWIGTFGGGLNRRDRESGEFTTLDRDSGLPDSRVMALLEDRSGYLWVGTFAHGLARRDPSDGLWQIFDSSQRKIGADAVMSLYEDRLGRIWIGTFGGGFSQWTKKDGFDRFQSHPEDPDSLSNDRVSCFAEGPNGMLWIGTHGGGLNRFDPMQETFRRYDHEVDDLSSLGSSHVFSLHVDGAGRVWVGTLGAGLARLAEDGGGFVHIDEKQGLPNDSVYGIQEDDSGRLWISTNAGLARFDPRTLEIETFDVRHGLQSNEFNAGASFRTSRGQLAFGGVAGFNLFTGDEVARNTVPPQIDLRGIWRANERREPEGTDIEIAFHEPISLEFSVLDYFSPSDNRFAYRLSSLGEQWIDQGSSRRLNLTGLDSGRHELEVRGANSDGTWSLETERLQLLVRPPFWRSWWAYSLYLVAIGSLIVANLFRQRRKLELEARLRRRLETEVAARTRELAERNEELEEANQLLATASVTDSLTGLWNRRFLAHRLPELLAEADRSEKESQILILVVDLDGFKPVNDLYGHAAGDLVLVEVARLLRSLFRASDTLVRLGGDEFLVLVPRANRSLAEVFAERLREAMNTHEFKVRSDQSARIGASIGFTFFPFHPIHRSTLDWDQALAVADQALYIAKERRGAWVGLLAGKEKPPVDLRARLAQDPQSLVDDGSLEISTSISASDPMKELLAT